MAALMLPYLHGEMQVSVWVVVRGICQLFLVEWGCAQICPNF
jgi:hypothetical protein